MHHLGKFDVVITSIADLDPTFRTGSESGSKSNATKSVLVTFYFLTFCSTCKETVKTKFVQTKLSFM
jgi:hypothetical protein